LCSAGLEFPPPSDEDILLVQAIQVFCLIYSV
jgi:hypothetical protein